MSVYQPANTNLDACSICGSIPLFTYSTFPEFGEDGRLYVIKCPNGCLETGFPFLLNETASFNEVISRWGIVVEQKKSDLSYKEARVAR